MNINELRNGNYVLLSYGNGRKDVCKIELIYRGKKSVP